MKCKCTWLKPTISLVMFTQMIISTIEWSKGSLVSAILFICWAIFGKLLLIHLDIKEIQNETRI